MCSSSVFGISQFIVTRHELRQETLLSILTHIENLSGGRNHKRPPAYPKLVHNSIDSGKQKPRHCQTRRVPAEVAILIIRWQPRERGLQFFSAGPHFFIAISLVSVVTLRH